MKKKNQLELNFLAEPQYVVSEIDIIYKSKANISERPQVNSSKDAYNIFLASWDMDKIELQEQFKVLYLNKANKVLALFQLSTGGITGTVADPRLVLVAGLKLNACSFITAHNHPSSNLKFSKQDEEMGRKFVENGKMVDMRCLDNMAISKYGYSSMADEGLMY